MTPYLTTRKYRITDWLPPLLLDAVSLCRSHLRYWDLRAEIARNAALRNVYLGEPVYVVANGPSLNNFGPPKLFGKKVIVMNHFELAEWKSEVEIVAHCIGEPFYSPAWEDPTSSIFGTNAKTYWLHISALRDPTVRHLAREKTLQFVQSVIKPRLWPDRDIRLDRPTLGYQTTAQLAIKVALFMGFKSIFLVGFDHDWLCTRGHSPHFYTEQDDIPLADLSRWNYREMIEISAQLWDFYIAISRSARVMDSQIVNLSSPSFLDVFPSGPLPDSLSESRCAN